MKDLTVYIFEKNNFLVKKHTMDNIDEFDADGIPNIEFIKTSLLDNCNGVKNVYVKHVTSWGANEYQIRIDYLEEKDYPHNIADNSIYLIFIYDITTGNCTFHSAGHIELTEQDKEGKHKYHALKSFTEPYKDAGHKLMRNYHAPSPSKLVDKISNFANEVYSAAIKDQGGELKRKK